MKIYISCPPIFRQCQHPQWWWIAGFRCHSLYNFVVICFWNEKQQDLCCQKDVWPPTPLWDIWKWSRTMFITKFSASQWKLFKFPYNTFYWPLSDSISRGPFMAKDLQAMDMQHCSFFRLEKRWEKPCKENRTVREVESRQPKWGNFARQPLKHGDQVGLGF